MPRVPVASLLLVGSPLTRNRDPGATLLAATRAVAAPLFADDEQQADPPFAGGAEPFGGRDLRRENALGVAGAAAVQPAVAHGAREKRRDAVEVRGEDDRRRFDAWRGR